MHRSVQGVRHSNNNLQLKNTFKWPGMSGAGDPDPNVGIGFY